MYKKSNANQHVITQLIEGYAFNHKLSDHGIGHWLRVMMNGMRLAEKNTSIDRDVVFWFALFHDSCRENETKDPQHGLRASQLIDQMSNKLNLNDEQLHKLKRACEIHSQPVLHEDPTIAACLDADRLDLARVYINTDSKYLSLESSRDEAFLAACIHRARTRYTDKAMLNWFKVAHLFELDPAIIELFARHRQPEEKA
ncbi:hypothetical protein [Photobacterium gaetbulicola]|uniref:hypothetical protein n=1 Tax=Photobacterium gaetbulicola TaxID=1295392 RepID=UPI00068C75AE|nr:hypothetical protein [Photobacterium gaetbulicola]